MSEISRQTIFPAFQCRDARAAIEWMERAFGATRLNVFETPDGRVGHAEIEIAGNLVMLGDAREGESAYQDAAPSPGSAAMYVVVDDVDALHARAAEAGAEVVREPEDTPYGTRENTVRDPEGNLWSFGTYDPRRPAPAG